MVPIIVVRMYGKIPRRAAYSTWAFLSRQYMVQALD